MCLPISCYTDISVFHITDVDISLLMAASRDATNPGPLTTAHEYGYYIVVSLDDDMNEFRDAGYSELFVRIYQDARNQGLELIHFDLHTPVIDAYPVFESTEKS